jgi:hypothetical protein
MHTKFLSVNLKGRDHSGDPDEGGETILEWILGKLGGRVWTEYIWLRIWTTGGMM